VVGPGESLSTIASKNDLTLAELVAVNAIEPPYHINPGQRLIIPASERELQQRARVVNEVRRQQAIDAAPSAPLSSDGFLWPVEGPLIRTFKENSAAGQSGAVNIDARVGTPVRATNNGIVAFVGEPLPRYGQMIVLRHAEGYVSLYAHTGVPLVEQGDSVSRGQVLTDVSSSGDVDEGQLRFELRKGLEPIDPVRVLAGLPSHKARSL
jgi:murein DD-endopeptidase MepM/ murein hydrolase activator NlpD